MMDTFAQFIIFSWSSLFFLIIGLNGIFTSEKTRKNIVKILEEGVEISPFSSSFYQKSSSINFMNVAGILFLFISLFIIIIIIFSKESINVTAINIVVYSLIDLLVVFGVLFFIKVSIDAFEKNRLKPGIICTFVATQFSAIPKLSLIIVFIIYVCIHFLFFLKILQ